MMLLTDINDAVCLCLLDVKDYFEFPVRIAKVIFLVIPAYIHEIFLCESDSVMELDKPKLLMKSVIAQIVP